jgi:crotonobetainyl-CoA:carnitine CoA-transferase CaiB-like acyl-CoA transferase
VLPLEGIRVLDLSRVLAGPWCTMNLADLGADVVKVESPQGDDTRSWKPAWATGESAYYLCANRSKRSIIADLQNPEDLEVVRSLTATADILVENFRVDALAKFGLDFASLSKLNPRLIYCSITGYGHRSPRRSGAGYDFLLQAESGLMSLTGQVNGEPMKVGVPGVDLFTGLNATIAVLAALAARAKTGVGQHIDMSLSDSSVSLLANIASSALIYGEEPKRYGNGHATVTPYQTFSASDSGFVLCVGNDRQFRILCEAVLSDAELARDSRFATNSARLLNREELILTLENRFKTQPRSYWLARLATTGIPAGELATVPQALASPAVVERDMICEIDHPTLGRIRLVGSPLKLSGTHRVFPRRRRCMGNTTARSGMRSRNASTHRQ